MRGNAREKHGKGKGGNQGLRVRCLVSFSLLVCSRVLESNPFALKTAAYNSRHKSLKQKPFLSNFLENVLHSRLRNSWFFFSKSVKKSVKRADLFQPRSRPFVWLLARTWIRKNTDCFAVYLHSLFTPLFSLKCAPLLYQCWATCILEHWDDCNTKINIREGETQTSVSRFLTSIVGLGGSLLFNSSRLWVAVCVFHCFSNSNRQRCSSFI